ncbi:MAG: hypothetical protein HZA93_04395 [Verrucomicrobia bacterium]|nr:hypothetical protein [Verrucomicrobiota bacterium]
MSEPAPASPPPDEARLRELQARQKSSLYFAVSLLVLCALALVALPIPKIPFFLRALIAAGDLIIAAVLWLVVRQKLDGR